MAKKTTVTRQSLIHLIQDLEDGTISPKDREILMELMRHHPAARSEYLRYMQMVALLQETAKSREDFGGIPVSQDTMAVQKRRSAMIATVYAIAAMLVLGLVFLAFRPDRGAPQQAGNGLVVEGALVDQVVIQAADGASYSIAHLEGGQRPENRLGAGDQLHVSRGLVRLGFPSGVEVLAEGPTDIELESTKALTMQGGSAWFRVPEAGRGFTVNTAKAKIVDLGTEFGVKFGLNSAMQVHVGVGRVTAESRAEGGLTYDLTAGKAIEFDKAGAVRPIDVNVGYFQRHFIQELAYIHWPFERVVNGRFEAKGPLAVAGKYDVQLKQLGSVSPLPEVDGHRGDGVFGSCLSLRGDGVFGEALYPQMGADTPRTFAAWVRHRVGESLDDEVDANGLTLGNSPLNRSYSTLTPWGEQAYLLYYTNASISTAVGAIPGVIEGGVTYHLSFQTSVPHGINDADYQVDLVAYPEGMDEELLSRRREMLNNGQVLATESKMVTENNLGHHGELSFRVGMGDPRIGQKLGIRLHKVREAIFYDEIRLTAQHADEDPELVFYEGFERPKVSGMHPDTLPEHGWVGSQGAYGAWSRGLYNENPPYQIPYCGWSGEDARMMWSVFMDNSASMRWCTGSGDAWFSSASDGGMKRNEWLHVASVYTGRLNTEGMPEVQHYINGVRQHHAKRSQVIEGILDRLAVMEPKMTFGALPGAEPGAMTVDGDLDEVFLIRGVLNQQQITELMQNKQLR